MIYSGFWKRFAAVVIDAVILIIPGILLNIILPYVGGVVGYLIYKPVFESSSLMATPGKAVMGIQVRNVNGEKISFQSALIRSLFTYVSSAILLVGYMVMFFSTKKQCLHDYIASTIVIIEPQSINKSYFDIWMDECKFLLTKWGILNSKKSVQNDSNNLQSESKLIHDFSNESVIAKKLKELQSLKEQGLITESDYEFHKNEILKKM